MPIGDLCNRDVIVTSKENSLRRAAELMRHFHVGDLVVVEGKNGMSVPVGILTDRDIVVSVVAKGLDINLFSVGDVMSVDLVTANEHDGVYETLQLMRSRGVRRLPVVNDDGALVGILTVDDLVDLLSEEMSDLSQLIAQEQALEQGRRPADLLLEPG